MWCPNNSTRKKLSTAGATVRRLTSENDRTNPASAHLPNHIVHEHRAHTTTVLSSSIVLNWVVRAKVGPDKCFVVLDIIFIENRANIHTYWTLSRPLLPLQRSQLVPLERGQFGSTTLKTRTGCAGSFRAATGQVKTVEIQYLER